jgi:DNA-binding response OmpR family regulator
MVDSRRIAYTADRARASDDARYDRWPNLVALTERFGGRRFSMDHETAGKTKEILLVDDDSQRLARTRQILTEAGYGVLSASSAEEAEALADTEAVFDLIICSVVMEGGGESGVHLAEHIERSKRTNSTLLVSPYRRDLLRHVPGFDRQRHFLSNPFSVEELLRRVRDLLAG